MFRRFTTFSRDEIITAYPVNIVVVTLKILNPFFLDSTYIAHQFCRVVGQ